MITEDNRLKEELKQVYIRYLIMVVTVSVLYLLAPHLFKKYILNSITLTDLFILGFISNTIYLIIIKFSPTFLEVTRIYIESFIDVFLTAMALVGIGSLAVYFPVLLLWYIVGYSSRYGVKISLFVIFNTIVAWCLVVYFSDFWRIHIDIAIGWLIAFLVIPLYFLKILYKLNKQYHSLYEDLNETQESTKYDFLTGLINRSHFEKELDTFIAKSIYENKGFALVFVDLDGFKKVNDVLGHDIGDEILIEVANRLKIVTSNTDVVARLGGDEFTVIVPTQNKEQLIKKAKNITMILSKPYSNNINHLSASIGISRFPNDAHLKTLLKKYADIAMYYAKKNGKNRFVFYDDIREI